MDANDFSSFLLQAKASQADYIVLGNGGKDLVNSINQAHEFKVVPSAQQLVAQVLFLSDLHAIGLKTGQGLLSSTGFYWDYNEKTRAWSKRFFDKTGKMPNDVQAGTYSAVLHYLKAIDATGTDDTAKVLAKMREMPVNDSFATNGQLRADGRMVHEMYIVQAKTPSESKSEWDLMKVLKVVPGETAFRPLADSKCNLVNK
jgi:branched-chain amino acid transport system substrate-binding protein